MPSFSDRLAALETHRAHDSAAIARVEAKLDKLLERPEHKPGVGVVTTTGVSAAVAVAVQTLKELFRVHTQ